LEFTVHPKFTVRYLKHCIASAAKKECFDNIDKFKLLYIGNWLFDEQPLDHYGIGKMDNNEDSTEEEQYVLHVHPRNRDDMNVRCDVAGIPFVVDIAANSRVDALKAAIADAICKKENPTFIYFFPEELIELDIEEDDLELPVDRIVSKQEDNTIHIKSKPHADGMFRVHVKTPNVGNKLISAHPQFTFLYLKLYIAKVMNIQWNEVVLTCETDILNDSKNEMTLEEAQLDKEDTKFTLSILVGGGFCLFN